MLATSTRLCLIYQFSGSGSGSGDDDSEYTSDSVTEQEEKVNKYNRNVGALTGGSGDGETRL